MEGPQLGPPGHWLSGIRFFGIVLAFSKSGIFLLNIFLIEKLKTKCILQKLAFFWKFLENNVYVIVYFSDLLTKSKTAKIYFRNNSCFFLSYLCCVFSKLAFCFFVIFFSKNAGKKNACLTTTAPWPLRPISLSRALMAPPPGP